MWQTEGTELAGVSDNIYHKSNELQHNSELRASATTFPLLEICNLHVRLVFTFLMVESV